MISETGNYFNRNKAGAMVFLIILIAITAMPPSGLFITEFWIFKALFTSSHIFIFIAALFFLTICIYSLTKNFLFILFNQTKDLLPAEEKPNPAETYTQYFLLAIVVYLGINPPEFMINLLNEAVSILPK